MGISRFFYAISDSSVGAAFYVLGYSASSLIGHVLISLGRSPDVEDEATESTGGACVID